MSEDQDTTLMPLIASPFSNPDDQAASIVVAFIHAKPDGVSLANVSDLIATIYRGVRTATGLDDMRAPPEPAPEPLVPAVPIKKSITPDYLICLEDGRKLKSLKRYLRTRYDLTPEQYKAKWGLAKDYPMVAPNYAAQRSALAKSMGLGRGGRPQPAKVAPVKKVAKR